MRAERAHKERTRNGNVLVVLWVTGLLAGLLASGVAWLRGVAFDVHHVMRHGELVPLPASRPGVFGDVRDGIAFLLIVVGTIVALMKTPNRDKPRFFDEDLDVVSLAMLGTGAVLTISFGFGKNDVSAELPFAVLLLAAVIWLSHWTKQSKAARHKRNLTMIERELAGETGSA